MIKPTYPGLSKEAADMLKHQYGFRTDAQSVQSIASLSPKEILNYEINELNNDDIPNTLSKLYSLTTKPDKNGQYDIDSISNNIEQLLNLQPDENYYLIWLVADWQSCFSFYADGHIDPKTPFDIPKGFSMPFIDVYQIHNDDALVSDLGVDGQLIATKHLPKPMHAFNY